MAVSREAGPIYLEGSRAGLCPSPPPPNQRDVSNSSRQPLVLDISLLLITALHSQIRGCIEPSVLAE